MPSSFRRPPRFAVGCAVAALTAALSGPAWADPAPAYDALIARLSDTPPLIAEAGALLDAADVRVEQASGLPTLTISVDRFAAANYGLSAADVSEAVSTAIGGTEAGRIFEGDRRFDVVVRLPDDARNDPATLAALPILSASGGACPCHR